MDGKTATGPDSQMLAPASLFEINQKLHHLTGPAYSGVLTPAKKPKDVEVEARSQRIADVKARGLRSGGQRGQVRSLNPEVLGNEAKT